MVRVITVDDVKNIIRKVTLKTFFTQLIDQLESDFHRWNDFDRMPRVASHFPHGVIELMPISDKDYYAYKYVNGHPYNPKDQKQTVVATGMLADVATGYPVLLSEMTILTALRTAATSALASKYLALPNSDTFGIVGTGAQSEFQVLAHHYALGLNKVFYYDLDPQAMEKFKNNLAGYDMELIACENAQAVVEGVNVVTTATAKKAHVQVLYPEWISAGMHINGIGGDCPGKTELGPDILSKAKIIVEMLEQSYLEGEIQHLDKDDVYAELWEIISGKKSARDGGDEITLFDSVGFALEDYSVLRLVYRLAEEFHVGHVLDMVPDTPDPKNLFSVLGVQW